MLPTSHPWIEGETLGEHLESRGVTRRDFLVFCGQIAAVLGLSEMAVPGMANALQAVKRPSVIWLQLQECTGCVESVLRTAEPTIGDLVLDLVSLDYQHTLMAGAGHAVEAALQGLDEGQCRQVRPGGDRFDPDQGGRDLHARSAAGPRRTSWRRPPRVPRRSSPSGPAPTGAASRRRGPTRPARWASGTSSRTSRWSTSPAARRSATWSPRPWSTSSPSAGCRSSMPKGGPCSPTARGSTTSARAGPTSTPASSWRCSTTRRRARAGACTTSAARDRRPSPPARSSSGTPAPAGRSAPGHPCIGCTEPHFWDTMTPVLRPAARRRRLRRRAAGGHPRRGPGDRRHRGRAWPTRSPPACTRCGNGNASCRVVEPPGGGPGAPEGA